MHKSIFSRNIRVSDKDIFVFDNLFCQSDILNIFQQIVANEKPSFARVNNEEKNYAPLLMSSPKISDKYITPIYEMVSTLVSDYFSNLDLTARRIQVNFNSFGEFQSIHQDQDSVLTVLYFANPTWKVDWLGEISFYDDSRNEVISAITPIPGRIVIFNSLISHRGGVPSRLCFTPRIVVAIKFN